MRIWILPIMLLMMVSVAFAFECQRVMNPKDIPCTIESSWRPSGGCSGILSIYNDSGNILQNLNWGELEPFCNATFNITTEGTYIYNSSIEDGIIVVEREDNMASLGIIIFLLTFTGVLFYLPFRMVFIEKSEAMNNIVKRSVWLVALAVLAFVTSILASLSENAGLNITQQIFAFQWVFVNAIYIFMILLFFSIFTSTPKLWKAEKERVRMGDT